ncbi:CGNR zinc finger domain-containing protein [Bacillus siamensis]|uniref:CGNR zinc finger domain-containing protein n=1 Tax=Bacillus siamensis TaxID=659243 RepID=UPI0022B7CDDE|nr:CGNR zinc finger domain-containing protein [Bacillus siamensis]MDU0811106.1 CGNR zinc finger domain-containing protein [Bacillus siamensis]MED5049042.1 CGNR zinc finger domain-containing protein [Bacillus siamensis]MED5095115.1 CGNR zinc finger domain-containing protein [Bacillus siamensis]
MPKKTNIKFPLISNHLPLDLVNTEVVSYGKRHNLIKSKEDLLEWLRLMGKGVPFFNQSTLKKAQDELSTVMVEKILTFRSILRENFEKIADDEEPEESFITFLEKKIESAPFSYKILDAKLARIPIGKIDDAIMSLIAYEGLSLIYTKKINLIKRCANEECVLLFLDNTGRRKWCSMKICGNREKVSRHLKKT